MPNLPHLPPPPQLQPPETPSWETPSSVWYTPRTTPWRTPQSTQSTPVGQMVLTKPATVRFNGLDAEPRKDRVILRQPRSSRTSLWIWCVAGFCFVFSLLLIFFAIATLIVFLAIRPRIPVFDIPNANLHTIYFDTPEFFNGDLSMLVNFTNPNKKIEVKFEKLRIELFFFNRLIAAQVVQPFLQKKHETRLEPIRLISSLVGLPSKSKLILEWFITLISCTGGANFRWPVHQPESWFLVIARRRNEKEYGTVLWVSSHLQSL